MAGEKVSNLPQGTVMQDNDLIYAVINGVSAKILKSDFENSLNSTGGDGYISGSIEWTGTGLTFRSVQLYWRKNNQVFYSDGAERTSETADGTHDRIDTFYGDDSGSWGIKKGVATTPPIQPTVDDTDTQIALTFALIEASATTPSGYTNTTIYDEFGTIVGGEADATITGGTLNSTTQAYSGTKSIEFDGLTTVKQSEFVFDAVKNGADLNTFSFRLYSTSTINNSFLVQFQASDLSTQVGNLVNIQDGLYGYDKSIVNAWQQITIPSSALNLGSATYQKIRIKNSKASYSFFLDLLQIQDGNSGNSVINDCKPTITTDTTTIIDLSNVLGNYCNMDSENTEDVFTLSSVVGGGKARVLINNETLPTITGATYIAGYGVEFQVNTPMYIEVESNGTSVEYWLKKIHENPIIDLTALPFGVQVAESSSPLTIYLGSPSILKTNTGRLLASHDSFSGGVGDTSEVFYSDDEGQSWTKSQDIVGVFWGKLFEYNNEQYILGTLSANDALTISKSTDDGETWTAPTTVLAKENEGFTKSSNNVIFKDGYLLVASGQRTAIDFIQSNDMVFIWADLTDLMTPSNWGKTSPLAFDGTQLPIEIYTDTSETKHPNSDGTQSQSGQTKGYLEPNVVEMSNGDVKLICRLEQTPNSNYAVVLDVNWDSVTPTNTTISTTLTFIEMNGGNVKFDVVWDSTSSKFWTITNVNKHKYYGDCRIEAYLMSSTDLLSWTTHEKVLGYDTTIDWENEIPQLGVQYSDFIIDGDDLLVATRTSDANANSYHNSNLITLTKVENFRTSTTETYVAGSLIIDENSERLEDMNGIAIIKDQSKYYNSPFMLTADNSEKPNWSTDGIQFDGASYLKCVHNEYLNLDNGFSVFAVVENVQKVGSERLLSKATGASDAISQNYFFGMNAGLGIQSSYGIYNSDITLGNDYIVASSFDFDNDELYHYLNGANRGIPDTLGIDATWNTDHIDLDTPYVTGNIAEMFIGKRGVATELFSNLKLKALHIIPNYMTPTEMVSYQTALNTIYSIY